MKKVLWGTLLCAVVFSSLGPSVIGAQAAVEPAVTPDEASFKSVRNIQEIIKEKTPEFIKKPILWVVNKLETFRMSAVNALEARKDKTRVQLDGEAVILNEDNPLALEEEELKGIMGEAWDALRYLEVFILLILLFIFGIKFIFYSIVIVLIFGVARFFWYRIY